MAKPSRNGLKVVRDPDPQTIGDWIRDIGADAGFCERTFAERLEIRMNSAMREELYKICKCEGGIELGELTRKLYLDKIAKFNLRKEACENGNQSKH